MSILAVRDPKVRIAVLVVLLLLVIGGMVSLGRYKNPPQRDVPDAPSLEVKREVFTGVPALDMTIAEQLTDYGQDARRRWPTEAIRYLLLETSNTPAVYAHKTNLLPITPGSAAEIEKDSRPWRFKYVRFRGELESKIEEEEYEAVYGQPAPCGRVWRGSVRVSDGDSPVRVLFITARAPTCADSNEHGPLVTHMIEDGWVRGRGILVQNYVDERGGDVPALLVVATQIERDFEPVEVKSLDDVPFDIISDDPALADKEGGRAELSKEYPRPLYRLVKYAEGMAGVSGAARRAELGLKPVPLGGGKAAEALVGQAAEVRGKYFGGLGVVVVSPERLVAETMSPNDAGVEECLNLWILTDERLLAQCITPGSLPELPKGTRVRWEGFFYKTHLYAANNGTQRLAPLFVLTALEEVKLAKGGATLFPVLLGGSLVVAMVLLAWIVVREDKTKELYRRMRQRKMAASRETE